MNFQRGLRRHRLHHPRARGRPARSRPLPQPLQLVPVPARHRDAGHAHGPAPGQQPGGGPPSRKAPAGHLGQLSVAAIQQVLRDRAEIHAEGSGRGILLRSQGRLRCRPEVRRQPQAVFASGQRGRCAQPGDPPCLDHPSTAQRRTSSRRPGSRRIRFACRSGWRISTTSCGISTRRSTRPRPSRNAEKGYRVPAPSPSRFGNHLQTRSQVSEPRV